ncbi:MAG: hypothetical protein KatS3mg097_151 [Candidatus Parcubacteria bacterium]|nr:MAG: hypothetical protein KatS3mg097_151 [Candidatus Parcubacteria bacterium]
MEKNPYHPETNDKELFDVNNEDHRRKLSEKMNIPEDQIKDQIEEAKKLQLIFYRSIKSKKYQDFQEHLKNIKAKYPDNSERAYHKSVIYNVIVGGSFAIEDVEFWDYEGEDSILSKCKNIFAEEIKNSENTNE